MSSLHVDGVDYNKLSTDFDNNVDTQVVSYNYAKIAEINENLNNVKIAFQNFISDTITFVESNIDSGIGTWDGGFAESWKDGLKASLNKNKDDISASIDVCLNNIKEALANAQQLNTAGM